MSDPGPNRALVPTCRWCPSCSQVLPPGETDCPVDADHDIEFLYRAAPDEDAVPVEVRVMLSFTHPPHNAVIVLDDAELAGWRAVQVEESQRVAQTSWGNVTRLQRARRWLANAEASLLDDIGWDRDNGTVGSGPCPALEANSLGKCARCGWSEREHAALSPEPAPPVPAFPPGPGQRGRSLRETFDRR